MSYNFTYLASPDFLLLSLHTITAISTPIYCIGMYCILFKTPDSMKSVKWYIFVLHFWTIQFDYSICLLTVPFILIHEFAGVPFGSLRYIGVPTALQTCFVIAVLAFAGTSIVSIYENRFYILCKFRGKKKWTSGRRAWLFLHYFAVVIGISQGYMLVPDQEAAKRIVFQRLPPLPDDIYKEPVFVVATDITYAMFFIFIAIALVLSEVFFFVAHLILNARKQQTNMRMSRRTYGMHKKLLIALVIQMTIPIFCVIIPICYSIYAVATYYYNQVAINLCFVIASTHGLVSTLVMIIVHRPYREAVITMIRAKKVSSLYVGHSDTSFR